MDTSPIVEHSISTFLINAFPAHLSSDVVLVSSNTAPISNASHPGSEIKIAAESLTIPTRIYQQVNEKMSSKLPHRAEIVYSCILTRHNDGYVRQRQLARIFDENQLWIAPFVVQLASEYVVEILHDIDKNFNRLDPAIYAQFLQENLAFYKKAKNRMISYWDCYHRWHCKHKDDYVGFQLFSRFDQLIES